MFASSKHVGTRFYVVPPELYSELSENTLLRSFFLDGLTTKTGMPDPELKGQVVGYLETDNAPGELSQYELESFIITREHILDTRGCIAALIVVSPILGAITLYNVLKIIVERLPFIAVAGVLMIAAVSPRDSSNDVDGSFLDALFDREDAQDVPYVSSESEVPEEYSQDGKVDDVY